MINFCLLNSQLTTEFISALDCSIGWRC